MSLLLLLIIPVVGALASVLAKGPASRWVAMAAALVNLAVVLAQTASLASEGFTQSLSESVEWLPQFGISLALSADGISLLLLLLTGILFPLILLSTWAKDYKSPHHFYFLALLMLLGLNGVFLAADAFAFYFFWEAALIPVYLLALGFGSANRGGVFFKFFVYTIFGSLFMLVALVYLYLQTGDASWASIVEAGRGLGETEQRYVFWALFLAFAIKMPIFPFHTWQPDTYTYAPAPVSMLLSGIMLKMGVYGVLRWLLPVVPFGVEAYGNLALILCIIGIVYGSVIAVLQNDIKRLVAYSSFAHVGLMGAGLFALNGSGFSGVMIQMLAHGINVVGLFYLIDVIERRTQTRELSQLGGLTQASPWLTVYFIIIMLGSVALPLTSGFIGEFLLLKGVFDYCLWYGLVAGLTIILGAVYMLRMTQKVLFGPRTEAASRFTELAGHEKLGLFIIAFLVLWLGMYPASFTQIYQPAVEALLSQIQSL